MSSTKETGQPHPQEQIENKSHKKKQILNKNKAKKKSPSNNILTATIGSRKKTFKKQQQKKNVL